MYFIPEAINGFSLILIYIIIIYSNLKLVDSLEINIKTGEISENCKEKFYSPIYFKILMNYLINLNLCYIDCNINSYNNA